MHHGDTETQRLHGGKTGSAPFSPLSPVGFCLFTTGENRGNRGGRWRVCPRLCLLCASSVSQCLRDELRSDYHRWTRFAERCHSTRRKSTRSFFSWPFSLSSRIR